MTVSPGTLPDNNPISSVIVELGPAPNQSSNIISLSNVDWWFIIEHPFHLIINSPWLFLFGSVLPYFPLFKYLALIFLYVNHIFFRQLLQSQTLTSVSVHLIWFDFLFLCIFHNPQAPTSFFSFDIVGWPVFYSLLQLPHQVCTCKFEPELTGNNQHLLPHSELNYFLERVIESFFIASTDSSLVEAMFFENQPGATAHLELRALSFSCRLICMFRVVQVFVLETQIIWR